MNAIIIVLAAVYIWVVVIAFQKGRTVLGWIGVAGLIPFLTPLAGWFPLVGALSLAKPESSWARNRYDHHQMGEAIRRYGAKGATLPPPPTGYPGASVPGGAGPIATGPSVAPPDHDEAIEAFLNRAWGHGIIGDEEHRRLTDFLAGIEPEEAAEQVPLEPLIEAPRPATPPEPAAPVAEPPPPTTPPVTPPPPAPTPPAPVAPARPQPAAPAPARPRPAGPRPPGPLATKAAEVWKAIGSDVTLHGFTYLGVLLTFVGVIGFLLFAFADVSDQSQPFVELVILVIFFGWSWALHRQGAHNVGDAMGLIGRVLLPLVLFAGFVDGAPFPPNFRATPLVVVLTATCWVLAGIYSWLDRRFPDSPYGRTFPYLVAPLVWLGSMTLGFVFKTDEDLLGDAITRLVGIQPAMATVAIALTLVLALRSRDHRLARPTMVSALIGLPIAYLLTIALEAGDGWSNPATLIVLGAGTMASSELLSAWFGWQKVMPLIRPWLLAGVVVPLVPVMDAAWAGLVIAGAYLILLETIGGSRSKLDARAALPAGLGLTVGVGMTVLDPVATLISFSALTAWAHYRRIVPWSFEPAIPAFYAAAALAPVGIGFGVYELLDPAVAWVVMASIVAATALAARFAGRSGLFSEFWPSVAALAVALGAYVEWNDGGDGLAVTSLALAGVAVGLGPRRHEARIWVGGGLAAAALAVGMETWDATTAQQAVTWAATGLALVIGAAVFGKRPVGHLAAIGHLMATGAVFFPDGDGSSAFVLAAWALSWIVAVVAAESGRESLQGIIARGLVRLDEDENDALIRIWRWVVPAFMLTSVPFAVLTALNLWDEFADHRSWTGVALAVLAVAYGYAARVYRLRRPLSRALATGAIVVSVIGVAVAAPEIWPMIVAAVAVIAVAALLTGDLASPGFVWFAWIVSVLLAALVGRAAGIDYDDVYLVTMAWGAVMLLGGLIIDDIRSGRRAVGQGLRLRWLRHPVLVGAAVLPLSLGPVFALSTDTFGWSSLGAAIVYFFVAQRLRNGSVSIPGYALLAVAAAALSPWSLLDEPWSFALVAAPMVVLSLILERVQPVGDAGWLGWERAPLVAAHGIGAFALLFALGVDALPSTALAFGLLSMGFGLWRRSRVWVETGNALVLIAAAATGAEWLTAALAATAVRGVVGTLFTDGSDRLSYQAIGLVSAAASWTVLGFDLNWAQDEVVSLTSLVFGGLTLLVALLGRFWRLRRDSVLLWGALGIAAVIVAGIVSLAGPDAPYIDGPWMAIGLALVAAAFELSPADLGTTVRRFSPLPLGLAWAALGAGLDWMRPEFVSLTALGFGGLAAGAGVLGRLRIFDRDASIRWGGLGTAGVAIAAIAGSGLGSDLWWPPAIAVGFVLIAAGYQVAAATVWDELRYLAVVAIGLSWLSVLAAAEWTVETSVAASTVVFSVLAVVSVEVARLRLPRGDGATEDTGPLFVARSWAALGVIGAAAAAVAGIESGESVQLLWAGAGLLALTLVAVRGAEALRIPILRELAALTALGSFTVLALGAEVSDPVLALGVVGIAVGATAWLVLWWRRGPESVWLRPLVVLGIAANLEALYMALVDLPSTELLALVALSIGVQALAVAMTFDVDALYAVVPPLLGAAFLLAIAESASGTAQWFTIPIGIVLLAEVDIWRMIRKKAGRDLGASELVGPEWVGVGLLGAPPLVEMFTTGVAFGLLAFAVAGALVVWAATTRVKRRMITAGSLAVAASVLILFAAAAGGAPDTAFFWLLAIGVGFSVMLVAALVEAYRSRKGRVMARLGDLMEGWE